MGQETFPKQKTTQPKCVVRLKHMSDLNIKNKALPLTPIHSENQLSPTLITLNYFPQEKEK